MLDRIVGPLWLPVIGVSAQVRVVSEFAAEMEVGASDFAEPPVGLIFVLLNMMTDYL